MTPAAGKATLFDGRESGCGRLLLARQDFTEQLHKVVASIVVEHDLDVLEKHWGLARQALSGHPVRRFYVRAEEGYANVAILTDGVVADIEGDDTEEEGHFTVYKITSLSRVGFYKEQVPTVPDSEEAELVMTVHITGISDLELYWIAKTEQEAEHLLEFGRTLVDLLVDSSD